jgi:hypothetical protein
MSPTHHAKKTQLLNKVEIPEELADTIRKQSWRLLGEPHDLSFACPHAHKQEIALIFNVKDNVMYIGAIWGLQVADLEVLTNYIDTCLDILLPIATEQDPPLELKN